MRLRLRWSGPNPLLRDSPRHALITTWTSRPCVPAGSAVRAAAESRAALLPAALPKPPSWTRRARRSSSRRSPGHRATPCRRQATARNGSRAAGAPRPTALAQPLPRVRACPAYARLRTASVVRCRLQSPVSRGSVSSRGARHAGRSLKGGAQGVGGVSARPPLPTGNRG